jgi:hypothetical protein
MTATPAPLSFCNVEVSPEGLVERDGSRRLASIPRHEIESVALGDGLIAERLLLQLVVAAGLVCAGGYLFSGVVRRIIFDSGPMTGSRVGAIGFFVLCFGVAALASSLRRGPHLRVTTRRGVRKLCFRRDRYYDAQQASAFVDDARRILSLS